MLLLDRHRVGKGFFIQCLLSQSVVLFACMNICIFMNIFSLSFRIITQNSILREGEQEGRAWEYSLSGYKSFFNPASFLKCSSHPNNLDYAPWTLQEGGEIALKDSWSQLKVRLCFSHKVFLHDAYDTFDEWLALPR